MPYFKVLNRDADLDVLPLLLTTVDVNITGVVAEVHVSQYFKNDGKKPLEAQYVFPGSEAAAVHALTMEVNDRVVKAKMQKRQEARASYVAARAEGKTASLLEQGDPGLFTMNLANILPGDDIRVEMTYSERLQVENGVYRFSFPATARPTVLAKGRGANAFTAHAAMGIDIVAHLNAPIDIASLHSLHHGVETDHLDARTVSVLLDPEETFDFAEDFVLEYSLQGRQISSGVQLYQEDDAGYALMMLEPPATPASDEVLPREYVFVLDTSGSMDGLPIKNAKIVVSELLASLNSHEYFNLVTFAGGSELLSEQPLSANEDNIQRALERVDLQNGAGGTDLLSALKKIVEMPRIDGVSRSLVILTDGAISVAHDTLQLIREQVARQNVFVIGVNNRWVDVEAIEAIAKAGQGDSFIIENEDELQRVQSQFMDYVRHPLLTDVQLESLGFEAIDLQPARMADLFARRPLFVIARYDGTQRGSLRISGQSASGRFSQYFDLDGVPSRPQNASLKHLWAREKIDSLGGGYDGGVNEAEITALGLQYNVLLSRHTSFVAVDQVVRNASGEAPKTVDVSLQAPVTGYGYAEVSPGQRHKRVPSMSMGAPLRPAELIQTAAIDSIQPQNRPPREDITFILGADRDLDNRFYAAARQIYTQHPNHRTEHVVDHLRSMAEVKTYLQANAPTNGQPWGVINLVSHSSPWSGLSVQLDGASEGDGAGMFDIHRALARADFQALPDALIDRHSEVRVIGCALGGQRRLMNLLSQYFGGRDAQRPVVKSPWHHVYIQASPTSLAQGGTAEIDVFRNPWFFVRPDVAQNPQALQQLLNERAPLPERRDAAHWDVKSLSLSVEIKAQARIERLSTTALLFSQPALLAQLQDMSADIKDFSWQRRTRADGTTELTGETALLMLKREAVHQALLQKLDFANPLQISAVHPQDAP